MPPDARLPLWIGELANAWASLSEFAVDSAGTGSVNAVPGLRPRPPSVDSTSTVFVGLDDI